MIPLRPLCSWLLAASLFLVASAQSATPSAVFPGAVGFGTATTVAGRGGVIVHVTNLNDSGTGSLRDALTTASYGYPRVVIFDVSGIIHLQSDINIRHANITLAGQTAPAPGIMIADASIWVAANDVLIQHIAARVGDHTASDVPPAPESLDNRSGFGVVASGTSGHVHNVVFDHISSAWGTDETFKTFGEDQDHTVQDVTVSNSLFAEGLRFSNRGPKPGETDYDGHSTGPLFGRRTNRITLFRNISAFNRWRNPLVRDIVDNVQIANNLMFWGRWDQHIEIYADVANQTVNAAALGNMYFFHPDLQSTQKPFPIHAHVIDTGTVNLFADGNRTYNYNVDDSLAPFGAPFYSQPDDQWTLVRKTHAIPSQGTITQLTSQPAGFPSLPLINADRVELAVMANAGARPAFRDPVDQRVVDDIANHVMDRGLGSSTDRGYVDHPAQVGGWPNWTLVTRAPTTPDDPSGDPDNDGYTNLEEWLHELAYRLEGDRRITRFDTFEDNDWAGWYADSPATNWSVVTDGSTKVFNQSANTDGQQTFLANTMFYDQVVQAKVKVTAFGTGYSDPFLRVYARYKDPQNAYYVTLRSTNRVELKKVENNVVTTFASAPLPINVNDWYSVRLSATGGQLSVTVKNLTTAPFASVNLSGNDTTPRPPGYAAVGTFFATAKFDDVYASPAVTSVPQLTDDFSDGTAADWTSSGGSWAVVSNNGGTNNVYRQNDATAALLSRASWNTTVAGTDQAVQATVKALAFPPDSTPSFVSVHARYADAFNNYYVTLRNTKVFELKKIQNNTVAMPFPAVTLPNTFDLAKPHTLRIEVRNSPTGQQLTGFLDGEPLLTMTDSTTPITAANKAAVGTFGVNAEFDNVVVSSP